MEICPKCHQLMTWYMTYNSGNPYCGYHCNNCGYDTMNNTHTVTTNNTHTVTTSKTISINNQPKPVIQEVVQVSDDSINKIADAVVKKKNGKGIVMIPEREREALMRLTMCARGECPMCKYEEQCDNWDFRMELATKNMNILADALRKTEPTEREGE